MSDVFIIPSHAVDVWRSMLLPHLKRFEDETQRTSAETILEQARKGERQIWGLHTGLHIAGLVVTEIYETTRGKVCWIQVAVGTATESMQAEVLCLYAHIEEWAKTLGCVSIGIQGRKGWLRVLPGFKQTAVLIEKDLT